MILTMILKEISTQYFLFIISVWWIWLLFLQLVNLYYFMFIQILLPGNIVPNKSRVTLHKTPWSHLISWCGNFVEMRSFRIVSDKAPETLRKLCVLTKLMHQKIRWNYGVLRSVRQVQKVLLSLKWNKRLKVDRIAFTLRKVKVTKCSKKWCGDFFETFQL